MKKIAFAIISVFFASLNAQIITNKPGSKYEFTKVAETQKPTVKDQCKTSTCWSYSTLSMMESELMRLGKGNYDLSEMFVARWAYVEKAITYVRMNGKHQFEQGGEGHDIPYILNKYGIVPESVYTGLINGKTRHNHNELIDVLKSYMETIVKKDPTTLGKEWITGLEGILDAYLGKVPTEFEYNGKKYTPISFAQSLGLNLDDYVVLTSFTHHPYYKPFALEVPDNWAMQTAYNVPLNEFVDNIKNALKDGYSLAWSADVGEKGFSFKNGIALVPMHDSLIQKMGTDNKGFNDGGANRSGNVFDTPCAEPEITDAMRQEAFDQQKTTDDHGMHITGMYTEKSTGKNFYEVKNSWGINNPCNGYLFVSEPYVRYKSISIMLHKNGLSKVTRKSLGI
jgi:bleomycin hydrolase